MQLIDHGDGLVTLDSIIRLPPGLRIPSRTTLLQLEDGGWLLLSPLPGIAAYKDELLRRGPVKAVLSPSTWHHLGLAEAEAAFAAPVFGPSGIEQKTPGLPLAGTLGDEADMLWKGEVEQLELAGLKPGLRELAFFHRSSRTLVLTDLCFHLNEIEHWPTRVMMRLNGAYGRFAPSRLMKSQIKDRRALRRSVDELIAWRPERVVVAHGGVIAHDGGRRLEEAFAFLPRA